MSSLVFPVKEKFEGLFRKTFSTKKNQDFLIHLQVHIYSLLPISWSHWWYCVCVFRKSMLNIIGRLFSRSLSSQPRVDWRDVRSNQVIQKYLFWSKTKYFYYAYGMIDVAFMHLCSGSHDHCMGGAAEGCCEDAEAADEECNGSVCIHWSKSGDYSNGQYCILLL